MSRNRPTLSKWEPRFVRPSFKSPIGRCPGPRAGSNRQLEKSIQKWAVGISTQPRNTNSQGKGGSGVEAPSGRLSVCLHPPWRRRRYCCGCGETCASVTIQLSLPPWRPAPPSSPSSYGALKKRKVQGPLWLWAEPVSNPMRPF